MSKPYKIYKHLVKNNVFGIGEKIKEQRKNANKRRKRA